MTKKRDIILGIVFTSFFIWVIVFALARKRSLEKIHNLGVGIPYTFTANGRGNGGRLNIDYSFKINSKEYKSTLGLTLYELSAYNCNNYFIGASFPVVYSPSNPANSLLLIRPKDFNRFGIPFPDSLNWVLKFLNE